MRLTIARKCAALRTVNGLGDEGFIRRCWPCYVEREVKLEPKQFAIELRTKASLLISQKKIPKLYCFNLTPPIKTTSKQNTN